MSIFRRWRFRAQLGTIRADLTELNARIDEAEHKVNQIAAQLESMKRDIN